MLSSFQAKADDKKEEKKEKDSKDEAGHCLNMAVL